MFDALWFKILWRELRGARRVTLLFVLNLTLGLLGLVVLDGLQRDLSRVIGENARALLSSDLSIAARRPLTLTEEAKVAEVLPKSTERIELQSLYSMVVSQQNSTLVQIKAIEPGYPYFGWIKLNRFGEVARGRYPETFFRNPEIWLNQNLADSWGIAIGDTVKLGIQEFRVGDIIVDESSVQEFRAALAPTVYIARNVLPQTKLIQEGSLSFYQTLFRLPDGADAKSLERLLNDKLDDRDIQVRSYLSASRDMARIFSYLNDYLGLVALTALALAGLGASYLFQHYLQTKRLDIGVLLSLGMSHGQAIGLYLAKLIIWGIISSALASLIAALIIPWTPELLRDFSPVVFNPTISLASIGVATMIAAVYTSLFLWPQLYGIRKLKAYELFQEQIAIPLRLNVRQLVHYIPALVVFWGLAVYQAHSLKIGSVFVGVMLGALSILTGLAWLIFRGMDRLKPRHLALKLSLRYVARRKVQAILCFVSLAISAMLINLIPALRGLIEHELSSNASDELPSIFLFDIQEEQIEQIASLIKNKTWVRPSPMVRGRLTAINDKPLSRITEEGATREEQESRRTNNRGVNLSYREVLRPSETLVAGRITQAQIAADGIGEITVEQRYAERLGLNLDDVMTFLVQGVPIKGRIVGLRRVRWNSFEPNFFIQFQPGLLDDAPKTFVAAVGPLVSTEKLALQRAIVAQFSNVSQIDVANAIEKILGITTKMSFVLLLMAVLTTLTGLAVLFSITYHQARSRATDICLLKVLGTKFRTIIAANYAEALIIVGGGVAAGTVLSGAVLGVFNEVLFNAPFSWNPRLPLALGVILVLVGLVVSRFSQGGVLRYKGTRV